MRRFVALGALFVCCASWVYSQDWRTILSRKDLASRGATFREYDDTYYARLAMGKMVLKTVKSEGRANRLWLFKDVSLPNDYIIEVSILRTEASKDFYGVFWGSDNAERQWCFLISSERRFLALRVSGPEETDLVAAGDLGDATLSPLRTADKLRVEKTGTAIAFLLNGTRIGECAADEVFGGYLGVAVEGNQSIEVDDIHVQVR